MRAFFVTAILTILGLTAAPAMAQSNTHLDQNVQNHIQLALRFDPLTTCPSGRTFFERFPNGVIDSEAFRVPGNRLLVITDFTWQATGTPGAFLPGSALEAVIQSVFGTQAVRTMYASPVVNLTAELASSRRVGGSGQIAAGVRIGSGRYLCTQAFSRTLTTTAFHTVAAAELNGYLIKK